MCLACEDSGHLSFPAVVSFESHVVDDGTKLKQCCSFRNKTKVLLLMTPRTSSGGPWCKISDLTNFLAISNHFEKETKSLSFFDTTYPLKGMGGQGGNGVKKVI